eukprot:TRINITY_DN21631_c0_g2_i1.p1 TRINITY_DN21631_c0_g2~~TRINITY_DN21631_c0_g2_i1.p1  ORF type:complete len:1478 (+),score=338.07 TRINITY_DN21631_c0_g2_i1:79-4512(+)
MSRQGKKGVRTRGSDDQQEQDNAGSSWSYSDTSWWESSKRDDIKGYKSDWKYSKSYDSKSYDSSSSKYDKKSYDSKSYDDSSHGDKSYSEKSYGKDYYDSKKWYEDSSNVKAHYSAPIPPPPPPPPPRGDKDRDSTSSTAGTPSQPTKTSSRRRKDKQHADKESRRGGSGGGEDEDAQVEEPDDEPDPSASQVPAPPQEFKVGNKTLVGTEVKDVLLSWVQTQNLDSWSVGALCRNKSESLLFEEKEGKGVTTVVLALPSSCVGILSGSRIFEEELRDGSPTAIEAARQRLAKQALDKLVSNGLLSSELTAIIKQPEIRPAKAAGAFQPLTGTGGADQRAGLRRPLEQWPETVQLYTIEFDDEIRWGLATMSQANFSYQLKLAGAEVRLEARTTDWLTSYASVVTEFHKRIISGDPEDISEMAVVRVNAEKKIDIEAMKDPAVAERRGPTWLPMLVQEMVRLSWWEVVRGWAPTEPSPSPMKLHTIFDEPVVCEEEVHATARKCLAKVGVDALHLAFVVDSVSEGSRSAVELTQAIEENLDSAYLAQLIEKTGLPLMGTRKNVKQEEAAEMLLALVGTHKLESDMFSVVRLWQWLSKEAGVLKRANGHTAGCPRYLGRTPSYMEFGEVDPPEEEKETGIQLLVRYEEYDDAYYRWNGSKAEEKRPEIRDCGWMRLVWDPLLGTFCSPSMLLPDGRHRPLPNKVCAWLRGRNIMKLVSIKHSMEATPAYSSLREEISLIDGQETEELYVSYKNHGEVRYRRSPGGLGMEIDTATGQENIQKLSYSESKKTLLSQVVTGWALPRKVVTWLLEGRCLADLIPGRKKASSEVKTTSQGASWTSNESGTEEWYMVKAKSLQGACSGMIYEAKVGDDEQWQALTYSEEKKEWLIIDKKDDRGTPIEVVVPCEAISHVASLANDTAKPSSQDSEAPRLNNPSSVRMLFPKLTGTELAEIEQQMDHRFKNPRLLAEALTHCSATRGTTPCYEKLAFVGDAALRSFASDRICRSEVAFFTAATVVKEGMPSIKSFCAPQGWQAWSTTKQTEWPPKDSLRLVESHEAVQRRLRACCNHVSYAHSCVRLGLHKAVNHSAGKDLEDALKKFASKVLKSSELKWQSLFKSGAPKVLGDLFLACVGAIVMDSDHMEADNLLSKHYNACVGVSRDCASASLPEWLAEGRPQSLEDVDLFSFCKAASSSGKFTLPPWIRDIEQMKDQYEEGAKNDFLLARNCTDICLLEVEQHDCVGSSPRSVEMKHSLEQTLGSDGQSQSDSSEPISNASEEEDSPKKEQTAKSEPEHDGAIYCWHCEMWLNGPTQWADHEIGKKHRKAVRRAQVHKLEGGEATSKEGKESKSSTKKDYSDAPKKPPPIAKMPDDESNYDLPAHAASEEDSANVDMTEVPMTREPPPPPPYPEGGWPSAGAEYTSQPDASPPVAGQTVWGYYVNPATGEWVEGTMLMPSSANTQSSYNWGYQGEFSNFEGIQ